MAVSICLILACLVIPFCCMLFSCYVEHGWLLDACLMDIDFLSCCLVSFCFKTMWNLCAAYNSVRCSNVFGTKRKDQKMNSVYVASSLTLCCDAVQYLQLVFFLFIFLFFTGSVWTSTASLMYRFTSTHVAIVWFITRLAAAATDWYHPLSIPVTVELYGHVYFLSVGNTTSPSDD